MKDCKYIDLIYLWRTDRELIKYPFILDAWIGENDSVKYGLTTSKEMTLKVLDIMEQKGYTSSIVKGLLE